MYIRTGSRRLYEFEVCFVLADRPEQSLNRFVYLSPPFSIVYVWRETTSPFGSRTQVVQLEGTHVLEFGG